MYGPDWFLPVKDEGEIRYVHPLEAEDWHIEGPPVYGFAERRGQFWVVLSTETIPDALAFE